MLVYIFGRKMTETKLNFWLEFRDFTLSMSRRGNKLQALGIDFSEQTFDKNQLENYLLKKFQEH